MRAHRLFAIVAFMLLGIQAVSAQYVMGIGNAAQSGLTTFDFDVYIASSSGTATLTSYQACFTYNSAVAGGGTISFSYLNGAPAGLTPAVTSALMDGVVPNLLTGSNAGTLTISTTPTLLGRFRMTNTVNFANAPFTVAWDFAGTFVTKVNLSNVNVTNAANHVNAMSPYQIILQNDARVGNNYEFDAVIQRDPILATDFTMTAYQISFTYNGAAANGGTLTFSYLAGTTTLTSCQPVATGVGIVNDGGTSNFVWGSNAGSQLVSAPQLKIGRFRVANTVPFSAVALNIAWDFAGSIASSVTLNNANLTVPANHLNLLADPPLPVELVSFTGRNARNIVELTWKTATENSNMGFDIERRAGQADWAKIGFVKGHGTSNLPATYTYPDKDPIAGTVHYRLKQIDASGNFMYHDAIDVVVAPPSAFALMQNSPNPFNPTTMIRYQVPTSSYVRITVYDLLGKEIASLVDEQQQPGIYTAVWNGRDARGSGVSSGVYMYRLSAGAYSEIRKMNLMK
ncbi:MAG TPA: T9SS type A sorting domain-containing protein [Bacteroidota bacterium]|nr:T9SS type A sorting domain-containing protein [Bacteroidota bacterium]